MKIQCFFNQVQVSEEPFEVYKNAPYIMLPLEIATDVCEDLLEAGIIDSFCIPALTGHAVKFNT